MKTRTITTIFALTAISLTFASCSETLNSIEEPMDVFVEGKSTEIDAKLYDSCDFTGTLTEADIKGLMEMREEEKLAREVYLFMYEKYNHRVFANIAKSENAHTSAVLHLINGFGLTDPTPVSVIDFHNPLFADLFVQLTEKGSESLVEALKVGAFIEEYDIADLQRLLEETQNETIKRVYGHLLNASKIHLRAFTNSLNFLKESYTPTILSVEEYNLIIRL